MPVCTALGIKPENRQAVKRSMLKRKTLGHRESIPNANAQRLEPQAEQRPQLHFHQPILNAHHDA